MLPTEEKRLLLALAAVVVAVTAGFAVLSALELRRLRSVEEETEDVEKALEIFRARARRIPLLESDVGLLRGRASGDRDALPASPFEDALVKGIQSMATAAKVRILGIRPATRPGTRSRRQAARADRAALSLRVEVRGDFFALLRFMNLLETYPRLISLKEGGFAVGKGEETSGNGGEEGPPLKLSLLLEAYSERGGGSGKPVETRGPVFENPKLPAFRRVVTKDRMNPFVVRLRPAASPIEGRVSVESPDATQARRLLQDWTDRAGSIRAGLAGGRDVRELFLAVRDLVKRMQGAVLPASLEPERRVLVSEWTEGDAARRIEEAYGRWVGERVRSAILKAELDRGAGRPLEIVAGFRRLIDAVAPGGLVPEPARGSFGRAQDLFLESVLVLLEEQGDARAVLTALDAVEKGLPEAWRRDPPFSALLPELEHRRRQARALVEFLDLGLVVSGLFWVPDSSGAPRVAIVNGRAVQEGERLPPDAVPSRRGRASPAAVSLRRVGRDRFVRFGYKGLNIRVALGTARQGR